jgi:hypothetical protein
MKKIWQRLVYHYQCDFGFVPSTYKFLEAFGNYTIF